MQNNVSNIGYGIDVFTWKLKTTENRNVKKYNTYFFFRILTQAINNH